MISATQQSRSLGATAIGERQNVASCLPAHLMSAVPEASATDVLMSAMPNASASDVCYNVCYARGQCL